MKAKNLFVLMFAIAISITVSAQKVALHSNGTVQHFTGTNALVGAYNASVSGDTIYLPGGSFYPPSELDKTLTIFGAGHYADYANVVGKTSINGNVTLSENADSFHLEGVEITGYLQISTNHSVNNVMIKRCKINGYLYAYGNQSNPSLNLSLIGNVLLGILDLQNTKNVMISNNIIAGTFANSNGNLISNNIFMGFYYQSGNRYLFTGDNNTLNNNIFLFNQYSAQPNGIGNSFNNNIYVHNGPDYGAGATNSGNYVGVIQDNIFVNQTGYSFDYSHDYHLQDPTTYLGTDGTQVGIYGGTFPYKEGAVPANPHFIEENIATTASGGQLNVQIKASAQNE